MNQANNRFPSRLVLSMLLIGSRMVKLNDYLLN